MISIARKLPSPIKRPLRRLYDVWRLHPIEDPQMLQDLAEYSGLNTKKVRYFLKRATCLNADFWYALNPRSEEEIRAFYAITPFYIFSLARWHMQRDQRIFHRKIIEASHGDVLDYGGGIGDLCVAFAQNGLRVTYADVGGKTFEFARWLFKKRGVQVRMIDFSHERLSGTYDTIICTDVIEHVSDPRKILDDFISHIRQGGSLVITNLCVEEVGDMHPMHVRVDFGATDYLASRGFVKENPWLWRKK